MSLAPPVWRRFGWLSLTSALLLLALVAFFHTSKRGVLPLWTPTVLHQTSHHPNVCRTLEPLRDYLDLPPTIQYARRTMRAVPKEDQFQPSIVQMQRPLIGDDFIEVHPHDDVCLAPDTKEPIVIEYSEPEAADVTVFLFGASTTLRRFQDAIPVLARWLAHTGASLLVNIQDVNSEEPLEQTQSAARAAGMDVTLFPNQGSSTEGDRHAEGHFNIVKLLRRYRKNHHQWFVVIDDDTFFPSLPNLLAALRPFDPLEPWYIGQLSDSWPTVGRLFGIMAYGGAGIILSLPVLETMYENFDECNVEGLEGDQLYAYCLGEVMPQAELTLLSGLHQLDMRGDASGWYESGPDPVLSLHHFNAWHYFPVQHAHTIVDVCGPQCFLHRYQFADDMVLTNSYSIVHYPQGVQKVDLYKVEATMDYAHDFEYTFGSMRPRLSSEEKVSWRLEYAAWEEGGSLRQWYVKRKYHGKSEKARLRSEIEGVLELEWSR